MSAALETEGELPSPVSASSDCGSVPAVSVSEAGVTSPVSERGAGHQGPTEAGIVPLGLVAAPVPATAGNSDFVPAESEQESPLSQPPVLQCPDCGKGEANTEAVKRSPKSSSQAGV